MNRKQFIQSRGATCRNWMWSWSFINHDEQFVIFGAWDSLNRLWLMALLTQPGFWLAFRDTGVQWWQVNILFTFAVMG